MFCNNCGNKLEDGARFCPKCGKPVGAQVNPAPQMKPVASASKPVTSQQVQPAKKSKVWIPIVIIVGVILIGLIVLIGVVASKFIKGKIADAVIDEGKNQVSEIQNDKNNKNGKNGKNGKNSDITDDIDDQVDSILNELMQQTDENGEDDIDSSDDIDVDDFTSDFGDTTKTSWMDVTPEARAALNALDTDYGRINWGVEYSIEDVPGLVISVAPYDFFDIQYLAVAFTNLYDETVSIYAQGVAKTEEDTKAGELYMYVDSLAPSSTFIYTVPCMDGVPSGVISWERFEINDPYYRDGNWEADWTITEGEYASQLVAKLAMTNTADKTERLGGVMCVLVDEDGNILGVANGYDTEDLAPGETRDVKVDIYLDEEYANKVTGMAVFCNPTITQ